MRALLAAAFAATLALSGNLAFGQDAAAAAPAAPASDASTSLWERHTGSGSWSEYETDTAPAFVSAAGLLGMNAGSVTNVNSLKQLAMALENGSSGGQGTGIAVSWIPARTGLLGATPANYFASNNLGVHLLQSLSLNYAQNTATIANTSYRQHAVAVQSSGYIFDMEDPTLRLVAALKEDVGPCVRKTILAGPADNKDAPHIAALPAHDGVNKTPDDQAKAEPAAWSACKSAAAKVLPWNASTYSFGYTEGSATPDSGSGPKLSLGKQFYANVQIGFGGAVAHHQSRHGAALLTSDATPSADDSGTAADSTPPLGYLLTVAYQRNVDAPVLTTVGTASLQTQTTNQWYGSLSGGTAKTRIVGQVSNIHTTSSPTAASRAFKEAIGVDLQVAKQIWLNFRYGRQLTADGTSTQNASLLSVSYSPTSLLN